MAQQPEVIEQEESPKKSRGKLILIALLSIGLIGGGAGGAYYYFSHKNTKKTAPDKQEPVFVKLDSFVVNLQSVDGEHYVQTEITVQANSEEDGSLVKKHMPEVRNRVIGLLSSKRQSELLTPEGKDQLNKEITSAIKQPFSGNKKSQNVSGVFFESFIVQ